MARSPFMDIYLASRTMAETRRAREQAIANEIADRAMAEARLELDRQRDAREAQELDLRRTTAAESRKADADRLTAGEAQERRRAHTSAYEFGIGQGYGPAAADIMAKRASGEMSPQDAEKKLGDLLYEDAMSQRRDVIGGVMGMPQAQSTMAGPFPWAVAGLFRNVDVPSVPDRAAILNQPSPLARQRMESAAALEEQRAANVERMRAKTPAEVAMLQARTGLYLKRADELDQVIAGYDAEQQRKTELADAQRAYTLARQKYTDTMRRATDELLPYRKQQAQKTLDLTREKIILTREQASTAGGVRAVAAAKRMRQDSTEYLKAIRAELAHKEQVLADMGRRHEASGYAIREAEAALKGDIAPPAAVTARLMQARAQWAANDAPGSYMRRLTQDVQQLRAEVEDVRKRRDNLPDEVPVRRDGRADMRPGPPPAPMVEVLRESERRKALARSGGVPPARVRAPADLSTLSTEELLRLARRRPRAKGAR